MVPQTAFDIPVDISVPYWSQGNSLDKQNRKVVPESSWLETNLVCELILLRKPGPIPLASRSISGNDDAMAAHTRDALS
jgi:hypothetical protein